MREGRRVVSLPANTELIFWRCQVPRVSPTEPVFPQLGSGKKGRVCGRWQRPRCGPAASGLRACGPAPAGSDSRPGGIQAIESGPHRRREKRLDRAGEADAITSPQARHCSVGMGERQGAHREKLRQSRVPSAGPGEGSSPGTGPEGGIPREERGLPAQRQQGCTRGKSRASEPVEAKYPGVWGQW